MRRTACYGGFCRLPCRFGGCVCLERMRRDGGRCRCRFFTFWAILATLQIYSASFFRLIGTTFRSIVLGTSTAGAHVTHACIPDAWPARR